MSKDEFRSGFVAIVGRSNVGKSTLLNRLLREKIAIVSDKPQTTRNTIRGILTEERYQIVFIDTPGIHKARDEINKYMVQKALATFREVDLVLFLVEPSRHLGKGDRTIENHLKGVDTPAFVLVNKIDLVPEEEREESVRHLEEGFASDNVFPVSALTGEGVNEVLERIVKQLPEGNLYFPPDQLTDHPVRFLCAEMIREKVFQFTGEEIPYAVAVEIVSFREGADQEAPGPVFIEANIHVDRPSQKGMVIGKGGQMLKRIGMAARQEMEAFLGTQVVLKTWVKVTRGWKNDPKRLRWLGYR